MSSASSASSAPSRGLAVPILCAVAAIGFVVSLWLAFVVAPPALDLFFNQKIFYFHVAHAFMLFTAVGVAGVCGILYLKTRKPHWDDISSAATEVAVAFGAVVLITGSFWARAAWDKWWNWEPRLTMSLLLWLVLVGCVLIRRFAGPSADRIAAGMALFGMVGVPFIYFMVGQDQHPNSGANGVAATLDPAMRGAFWCAVGTFLVWFVALLLMRLGDTRAEREVRELRERALDLGVIE
jgi:heme exporter protein C|nr:cytochrome c biogenesis protein CcsA [Kofleriaceae bacterium]